MLLPKEDIFSFVGHEWSPEEGKATFRYRTTHRQEVFEFTETLTFPQKGFSSNIPQDLLDRILTNVHIALGVSYYKLFCPPKITLEGILLSKEQAEFWNTVYTKGLGEFFYKNHIDPKGLVAFPFVEGPAFPAVSFPRQDRSLLGIGGGKDSIVAGELLKELKKPFAAFVVNNHPIKEQTIKLMGVDAIVINREIDKTLLGLNNRPDAHNGHVPVSSLYAFIGLLTALLYDYSYVIVGNEQSANYGNMTYLGEVINHQWSKSYEFEVLFQNFVKAYITPDVHYFSLLRPMTELAIAKLFSTYPQYFPVFSSCNKNFQLTGEGSDKLWCGICPKCAFTFIMLAAFLPKDQVIQIFGKNLLAQESLLQTYQELLGVGDVKPFDCVGTPDDVRVAFYLTMQKPEYKDDFMVKYFAEQVLPADSDINTVQYKVFELSPEHSIPQAFQQAH